MRPTVQPIAEDYLRELGADLLQVHDRRGARLATVGGDIRGVLRVVEVPIRVDQDQLGVLTVGYLLDEDRAMELGKLTGAEIAFAADGAVQASSLGPDSYPVLNDLPPSADSTTIRIGDTEYVALVRPLHPETAGRPASVVVMHSRTARMRTLAAIQTFLVGLAIGSVLHGRGAQLLGGAHRHAPARHHHRSHAAGGAERRPHPQDRRSPARTAGTTTMPRCWPGRSTA